MIHAVAAIISGHLKLRKYLKICRIPEGTDLTDRFSYRGGLYDREKFIELVCRDFRRLTEKECLQEAKALVDRLGHSEHPELDLTYIEAFRRILEEERNPADFSVKI